jgi:hypothetical protein
MVCESVTGFMIELHALAEIHQGTAAEVGTLIESWSDEEDYDRRDRHHALIPTLKSLGTHVDTIRNAKEAIIELWQPTDAELET